MKKYLLFLVIAYLIIGLQINTFAQMQGIISSSSERVSRTITPVANTVKVKKYTDSIMITLCQDTNNSTSTGTLYWFDRRFITTQNICYDRYTFNAHFDPTNPMGNMTYGIITCSKNVYSGNFTQYSTIYSTTCLD